MRYLFNYLKGQMESGRDAVLVTIVADSGSVPRGAGARMLVTEEGRVYGGIGGGQVAHDAEVKAIAALREKRSFLEDYTLNEAEIADLGLVCDGDVVLHFQYIEGPSEYAIHLCDEALALFAKEEPMWLITDINGAGGFATALYSKSDGLWGMELSQDLLEKLCRSRAVRLAVAGRHYYAEPLVRSGYVYIFGGSQIAQELTPLLTNMDFRCIIYEDREEFAQKEMFPGAKAVILGSFVDIAAQVNISRDDYVVVTTRGRQRDYAVVKQAMATEACYIGVGVTEEESGDIRRQLAEEGIDGAGASRLSSPMGLPIKGETPAEMAVGIAAEMILKRAERMGC